MLQQSMTIDILFVGNLLKRMFNARNLVILAFIGFSNDVAAKMSFFIKGLWDLLRALINIVSVLRVLYFPISS